MFTANTQLTISETDHIGIKNNLKNFVKNKTEFQDYNFEGSTLNYLLDILSVDAYMRSIYTNMAINETFIDTAQIRSNIVSNAKKIGYTPKSARSSKAKISVSFQPTDSPAQIVIPAGSRFIATKDGVRYTFQTIQEYNALPSFGRYTAVLDVYEGDFVQQTFTYTPEKVTYELLNENVDISTLTVGIKENAEFSFIEYYTRMNDLTELTERSAVYFLQENSTDRYEIYFGDDILGKRPLNNSQVYIEYVNTSGSKANGIQLFSANGYVGYNFGDNSRRYSPTSITTINGSANGLDKESTESIRFNAVNNFPIQGRLVVKKDFEDFIRKDYEFIQAINVWGGEDNVPPLYGKTVICLKPYDGYALTQEMKDDIIYDMRKRNVMSIEPIIVDPIFMYVVPDIIVTYDSSKTTNSADQIYSNVQKTISDYERNTLSGFEKAFRYSTLVRLIDKADTSIISNQCSILYEKRLVPIYNSTISYKLEFNCEIRHPYSGYLGGLVSSGFKTNSSREFLYFEDDGLGKINMVYYDSNSVKIIFRKNVGTVDYRTGKVELKAIYFTELENPDDIELQIQVQPETRDIEPLRNNIILFARPTLRIVNILDRQIVKSGILDSAGNISPLYTNSLTT